MYCSPVLVQWELRGRPAHPGQVERVDANVCLERGGRRELRFRGLDYRHELPAGAPVQAPHLGPALRRRQHRAQQRHRRPARHMTLDQRCYRGPGHEREVCVHHDRVTNAEGHALKSNGQRASGA